MTGPRLVALTGTGQVSGAERVLVRLLAAAVEAGWDVTCLAPAGALSDELAAAGVRRLPAPELGRAGGSRPAAAAGVLLRWAQATRLLRRAARGSDLVLVNSLTALPVLRAARVRAPAAWLAHDVLVSPDRLRLFRACRGALTCVLAVSEAVAASLGRPGTARVEVVHNGVPWPVEPARRGAEGPPVVGISALLTPWKGHQVVLDAAPLLPPGVVVELMGGALATDEEHAARVRERAAAPDVRERVQVLGHVTDPVARMRSWTVAVSASTQPEACPLNVLEAMSLGVPVVATDHGGAREVLAGAGLLVPPGDPVGLAAAVTRLLTDPDLHERCAARGRDRVATAHRLEQQTDRALRLLGTLAAGGRP